MPSKSGGMGLRSGTHTTRAQHLASLAKSSEAMRKWSPEGSGRHKGQANNKAWG